MGRKSILIVEDDNVICDLTANALRAKGLNILCAYSALAALEIYQDSGVSFDLVLTDMQMPGMNGAELINNIKSLEHSRLPIFFILTGHAELLKSRSEHLNDVVILNKPISNHDLFHAIDAALNRKDQIQS